MPVLSHRHPSALNRDLSCQNLRVLPAWPLRRAVPRSHVVHFVRIVCLGLAEAPGPSTPQWAFS
jgi:hypothetical protein